jgi:hypothetical protein
VAHEPEQGEADFVEIASFTYLAEALLARELLETEGIEVRLRNEHAASAMPHMTNALGGVGLAVAAADVERADELLAPGVGEPAEDGAPDGGGPDAGGPEADAGALDGDEGAEPARDALARRAWRAAILGLVFLPVLLHLYSAWLALRFHGEAGPASPASRRRAGLALLVDAAVIGLAAYLLGWRWR